MAYDNNGFMEKLRLNNVFPSEGMGNPNPLIGMPDFTYGGSAPRQQQQGVQQVQQSLERPFDPNPVRAFNPPRTDMASAWIPGAADINAGRIVMGETPREEQQRKIELQQPKYNIQQQNANINQQKVNIAQFKAQNPNVKFVATKGGNVTAFDPITGEAFDTGINSGTMSEEDKQELIGSQHLAEIGARGTEQRANTTLSGNMAADRNRESIAGREKVAGANNDARSLRDQNNAMQPSQVRIQQQNAARELLARRPDLAQFIATEPNGNFSIVGNPDLDSLATIQNAIYSSTGGPLSSNTTGNTTGKALPKTPTSKTPTANMSLPSAADLIEKYSK